MKVKFPTTNPPLPPTAHPTKAVLFLVCFSPPPSAHPTKPVLTLHVSLSCFLTFLKAFLCASFSFLATSAQKQRRKDAMECICMVVYLHGVVPNLSFPSDHKTHCKLLCTLSRSSTFAIHLSSVSFRFSMEACSLFTWPRCF